MKKLISIVLIVVALFMLTSCYDPRYVANENWEDIQGTLVEKYQESDKGNVYNFFRIDINGEILLKKAPDEVYYAYSEGDIVFMQMYKAYNGHDELLTVNYYFKIPKEKNKYQQRGFPILGHPLSIFIQSPGYLL